MYVYNTYIYVCSFVSAVTNAIAAMVAAIRVLQRQIHLSRNYYQGRDKWVDAKELKEEYEKIRRDVEEYTNPIIKALNELPVYYRYHINYRYHIKKGLVLGKGLKIVRYQDFTKKHNHAQKRKEKKRKEIKQKEEDVEDVLANQFNDTMNTSTKRRRDDDV